ncbi:hypothetical protein PUN28_020876 [Cardiocondyla obscurior]|uniref:Uncharacterized protein n=1 Tax=Cardiocondyla obscurior TaxID=286306 RepID=A0AAW2E7A8_9HYME
MTTPAGTSAPTVGTTDQTQVSRVGMRIPDMILTSLSYGLLNSRANSCLVITLDNTKYALLNVPTREARYTLEIKDFYQRTYRQNKYVRSRNY